MFAILLLTGAALGLALLPPAPGNAAQTIPYKLNFQGRLTNSAGNTMPDGLYNMQFRLYDAASGGTLLWSETRETASRVSVTNGLFSTQLGDVTSLPPSLFNSATPRYFEITLATPATATCSTAACATWESPMTPRQALGAAAYAMNADTLDGIDGDSYARRDADNTFSGYQVFRNTTDSTGAFSIQNAGGTNLLQVNTSTGEVTAQRLAVTNTTDAILGNSVNGTGVEGYSDNSTGLLGVSYASVGLKGSSFQYYSGFFQTAVTDGSNTAATLVARQNTAQTSALLQTQDSAGNVLANFGADGSVRLRNATNSSVAFQVQNAQGEAALNIITNNTNLIANSSFESDTQYWSGQGGGIQRVRNSSNSYFAGYQGGYALALYSVSGSAGRYTSPTPFAANTQYTVSYYAMTEANAPTLTVTPGWGSGSAACSAVTPSRFYWTRYSCTFTTGATVSASTISFGASTADTVFIDAVQLETGPVATFYKPMSELIVNATVAGLDIAYGALKVRSDDDPDNYAQLRHSGAGGNLHLDSYGTGTAYISWFAGNGLHVGNGNRAYGAVQASAFNVSSSLRYKMNVRDSRYRLADLLKLMPKEYTYIDREEDGNQVGLIAEEVAEIFPEAVKFVDGKPDAIDYSKLVPLLISAIKEQNSQVVALNDRVVLMGELLQSGSLSIDGSASIGGDLTVAGTVQTGVLRVMGHIVSGGAAPTVQTVDGSCSQAEVRVEGTDTAGKVTIVPVKDCAPAAVAHLVFAKAYGKAPVVSLTPANADAARLQAFVAQAADGFRVMSETNLQQGRTYQFNYMVIE